MSHRSGQPVTRYDSIGQGYAHTRRPDPRIAAHVDAALAGCETILNVGAGTGSYEPEDRFVIAVEPSGVMIRQRAEQAAPAVQGSAAALPFATDAFDATLAVLTIHHWPDVERGLEELRRVARRRIAILTFDTSVGGFWLTDYFPEMIALDAETMPPIVALAEQLGDVTIVDIPVPHDCVDGFLGAYWRRPEAYLLPEVRNGTSLFSLIQNLDEGVERLRSDLASGAWNRRYGELLDQTELDLGYRLVIA